MANRPSPAMISVDLSNYVSLYGVEKFDETLTQILKGFVDMGQYPPNIPSHDVLAKEIHKTLNHCGIYHGIKKSKHQYTLRIGEPMRNSVVTYTDGSKGRIMVPDPVWWILIDDLMSNSD